MPSCRSRSCRAVRIASQPTWYVSAYFAMSSAGACNGKCGAVKARYRKKGRLSSRVAARKSSAMIGKGVGAVELAGLIRSPQPVFWQTYVVLRLEKVRVARQQSIKLIETADDRARVPEMPLTAHQGAIVRASRHFGQRHAAVVQVTEIAGQLAVSGHQADPGLMRIQAGQQACAGRAATRGVVHLRQTNPVGCEGVEVRRTNLAAEATDVGEAEVIGKYQYDIWTTR